MSVIWVLALALIASPLLANAANSCPPNYYSTYNSTKASVNERTFTATIPAATPVSFVVDGVLVQNSTGAAPQLTRIFSEGTTLVEVKRTSNSTLVCSFTVTLAHCLIGGSQCKNDAACTPIQATKPTGPTYCKCTPDYIGSYCETKKVFCAGDSTCSSHGTCDFITGLCKCDTFWDGVICDHVPCPASNGKECNNKGVCHTVGVCQCDVGWMGSDCSIELRAQGITAGAFAGAVIGGLLISFLWIGGLAYYLIHNEAI